MKVMSETGGKRDGLRLTSSVKKRSMSSASDQPRISVTARPQNHILASAERTKMIASESSCMRRSAQRFLFVNSKVARKADEDVDLDVEVDMRVVDQRY